MKGAGKKREKKGEKTEGSREEEGEGVGFCN